MKQGPRKHELCGGKYLVTHENGVLTARRNGEEWPAGDRALSGDGLSLAMIQRIEDLEDAARALLEWIDSVPENVQLPVMPGIDRDWVDSIISNKKPNFLPHPRCMMTHTCRIYARAKMRGEVQ